MWYSFCSYRCHHQRWFSLLKPLEHSGCYIGISLWENFLGPPNRRHHRNPGEVSSNNGCPEGHCQCGSLFPPINCLTIIANCQTCFLGSGWHNTTGAYLTSFCNVVNMWKLIEYQWPPPPRKKHVWFFTIHEMLQYVPLISAVTKVMPSYKVVKTD